MPAAPSAVPDDRAADPILVRPDRVVVRVHVRPRASSAGIVGFHGDALAIRVTVPPVDGRANDAVARVLAAAAGVAPSAVRLVAGATARGKRFEVLGNDPGALATRLRAAVPPDAGA